MTPYQALMADAAKMTDAQLKSFAKAVMLVAEYISGNFMGEKGRPKLLVAAPADQDLVVNAMAYLSKFVPNVDYKTLYRVHDAKRMDVKVGQAVTVKPFRSFLSWSENPAISVEGVENLQKEVLLAINGGAAKVIFSNRVARAFVGKGTKDPRLARLSAALLALSNEAARFKSEKEVVVYHSKPFTAKVLRVVDTTREITKLISDTGLAPYLKKRANHTNGDANFQFNVKDRPTIEALLNKHLGRPKKEKFNSLWRADKHDVLLFQDDLDVHALRR
jgi:hypothetical protein